MAPKIQTPVEGFNGQVAGVNFADGVGETTDKNAIAYFKRHGYTVGGKEQSTDKQPSEKEKLQAEAAGLGLSEDGTSAELKKRIAEHKAKVKAGTGEVPGAGEGRLPGEGLPADGIKGKDLS